MGHKDDLAACGSVAEGAFHPRLRVAERIAWDRLQLVLRGGSPAQMREELAHWSTAMRALWTAQTEEALRAVQRTADEARASAAALPPDAGGAGSDGFEGGAPPLGQRLRSRDGTLWEVTEVAHDALEPGCFLLQLEEVRACTPAGPESSLAPAPRSVEVYSDDWPMHCIAHGLHPA